MDKISQLPDELLVKILLFLPTKVAVSTSILSKRWEFIWMWLPKLEYDYSGNSVSERKRLQDFINLNLPLHRAPVLESLSLKFNCGSVWPKINPEDIKLWVLVAVSQNVRELSVNLVSFGKFQTILPSSLYICKSIVILKLRDVILVDVPRMVCLPSLKILFLQNVTYKDENTLHRLLSSCPVLEDLVVKRWKIDNLVTLTVVVQSLQRLILKMYGPCHLDGIILNTPSLKYLKVTDTRKESDSDSETDSDSDRYAYNFKDMPKLEEADFDLTFQNIGKFFGSITSVKRLSLCLGVYTEDTLYGEGIVFNQLEYLKLCSCDPDFSFLLLPLLKDSPNLLELEVNLNDAHTYRWLDLSSYWNNQLNSIPVPHCLLSTLETFKWTGMHVSYKEMELAKYILRNARRLKTATIMFHPPHSPEVEMVIQKLSYCFRGSETCQLVFE